MATRKTRETREIVKKHPTIGALAIEGQRSSFAPLMEVVPQLKCKTPLGGGGYASRKAYVYGKNERGANAVR